MSDRELIQSVAIECEGVSESGISHRQRMQPDAAQCEGASESRISDRQLFLLALETAYRAYAPYSGFRVGAALLVSDGRVFSGVNVENSSYGATICAERTAAVKAVSEGALKFCAIAVASPDGPSSPCGICRQFLFEFGEELRVITGRDPDHLRAQTISQLLPEGFRLEKERT